jgi:tetratricopeptide (TPR) repeat protein
MRVSRFNLGKVKVLLRPATVFLLICIIGGNAFAQYKGAPVKKDRLLKALRSRQLQTNDIVSVINSNGVDFALTDEIKKILILAGARPEVINAVANNPRLNQGETFAKKKRANKTAIERDYEDLLEQALYSYKDQNNPFEAARFLQTAVKLRPKDSKAYQMLGFINLYGLNNLPEAQKYMRLAIDNGGSAVFRVYHDDKGSFSGRCTGSLYISPERIRFESDDNIHTFETSTVNVDKTQLDRESSKIWKNHPIFKVFLKIGKDKMRFRFAPVNGKLAESQMATSFIEESRTKVVDTNTSTASLKY